MNNKNTGKPYLVLAIIIAIIVRIVPLAALAVVFISIDDEPTEDPVIMTMPDYVDGHEWIHGFWQDFTSYGEYRFNDEINQYFYSEENIYFKPVDSDIKCQINDLLDDYEEWVKMTENPDIITGDDISKVYNFKRTQIDDSDWYYCDVDGFENLDVEEYYMYASYDFYYYDSQSRTLYYMHNNI